MESIKQISRKYIIDDDYKRLLRALDGFTELFASSEATLAEVLKKHLVEITEEDGSFYIEFDKAEKIVVSEENIFPYLEYVLGIYKSYVENPNSTRPIVKVEPQINYMEICVDDARVVVKTSQVDIIFKSLLVNGLIDSYSIYSSDEKYQRIKKSNYCLSLDEFGVSIYKQFELPKIEKEANPQKVLKSQ